MFLIEWTVLIPEKQGILFLCIEGIYAQNSSKAINFRKRDSEDVFAFINAIIACINIRVFNYHMFTVSFNSG